MKKQGVGGGGTFTQREWRLALRLERRRDRGRPTHTRAGPCLITISSVSREKTKYSPGERSASSLTRHFAVSMSSTVSIQTGVPRRSFLNISKGVALIEQPLKDRIQDWVFGGTLHK